MAVENVSVNLDLDSDEFQRGILAAVKLIGKLEDGIGDTDERLKRNRSVIRQWVRGIRGSLTELESFFSVTDRIRGVVTSVGTSFIEANAGLEKTTAILAALNQETGKTASEMDKTNESIEQLRELARTTPFTLDALQNSFVKFRAGGLDPTDGSLQSLIDSVAKFGGTAAELDRASIAIQQMSGKGVVSMEELRQQLGEAVPNAMQLMADGLGVSMGEFAKTIETGTLKSTGALQAMFTQMELENAGAAENMTTTWDGLISQIGNRITELFQIVGGGDSGLFNDLKVQLADLLQVMKSAAAEDLAAGLGEGLRTLVQGARLLVENIDLVISALKILGIVWAASLGKKALAQIPAITKALKSYRDTAALTAIEVSNFGKSTKQAAISGAALTAASTKNRISLAATGNQAKVTASQMKALSIANAQYQASIAVTTKTLGKLARGFVSMLGPIGLVLAIAYEVASAFDLFGDKLDEVREKAQSKTVAITADEFTDLTKEVADSGKELDRLNARLAKQQALADSNSRNTAAGSRALIQVQKITSEIAELEADIAKSKANLETQVKLIGNDAADLFNSNYRAMFTSVRRELQSGYNQSLDALKEYREENPMGLSPKEITKQFQDQKTALDESQAKLLAAQKRGVALEVFEKQKADILKSSVDKKAKGEQLSAVKQAYDAELVEIKNGEDRLLQQIISQRETGVDVLNKGGDFWDEAYRKSYVELASWTAKLNGENVAYAKNLAKLSIERQKDVSFNQADAEAIGRKVEATKEVISINKQLVASEKKIAQEQIKLASTGKSLEETNPWLKMSGAQKQYINLVAKAQVQSSYINETLGKTSEQAIEAASQISSFQSLLNTQQGLDYSKSLSAIDKQTSAIKKQFATEQELQAVRKKDFDTQNGYVTQLTQNVDDIAAKTGKSRDEVLKTLSAYSSALEEQFNRSNETAFQKLMRDWSDTTTAMDQLWTNSMTKFSDALTDFVMTGKLDFESLTQSIMRNLIQMSIQAATSGIFQSLGTTFAGAFGGGAVPASATPAVASSAAPTVTSGAIQSFAASGTSRATPSPYSMPYQAEGRTSQSGSSQPNVSINLINQTGQEANAEQQGGMKFDGERWVLDIVMKAMGRPGQFRTAMKGNTRQ